MVAATLLVVSGSFAKADQYSVVSAWQTGSSANDDLDTFTGNGTFDWNGTTFSNISFDFTETSIETCSAPFTPPCVQSPTNNVIWTATSNDGELLNGNKLVILGNGPFDCAGTSCVQITLASPLTQAGFGVTFQGVSGFTQDPNTTFNSATITDLPEPSAIAVLGTVSGILGFVIFRRRKLVR